jgi:laccase
MLTRREFLNAAAVGAAGLLVPWNRAQAASPKLTPFKDALPIPGVLSPTTPGGSHYRVVMSEFSQQLHSELPATAVWGVQRLVPWPDV